VTNNSTVALSKSKANVTKPIQVSQKKSTFIPVASQMSSAVNGSTQTASVRKASEKSEEKPQEHAKIQTHT
jgi:hypothetical protein